MSSPPPSSPDSSILATVREAWRRSFDSVQQRQVSGSHLLRINGISAAGDEAICSRTFRASGHKWRLSYYPNAGSKTLRQESPPAVELERIDRSSAGHDDNVTAEYRLSILGRDGSPAYSYSAGRQRFDRDTKYSHRVEVLASPEQRQAAMSLIGDDSLAVRCDITTHRFHRESTIKRFIRELLAD